MKEAPAIGKKFGKLSMFMGGLFYSPFIYKVDLEKATLKMPDIDF